MAKAKKNTGKGKLDAKTLVKNVKSTRAKVKANRRAQIANRGIVTPRNAMVEGMIQAGPVKREDVVNAILEQYPTTSKKMAMRTITRGKNEKYNTKYTKFKNLIVEKKVNGEAWLAFTKKALSDMEKASKAKTKKTKAKKTTKKTSKKAKA